MLKIKNKVDLNELEKFGFKYKHEIYYDCIIEDELLLDVFISSRRITNYSASGEVLNVLYDLIQAGLVENMEVINNDK